MMKVGFEHDELIVLAMMKQKSKDGTEKKIRYVMRHGGLEEEMQALLLGTADKLSKLRERDFQQLDLKRYQNEAEEEE